MLTLYCPFSLVLKFGDDEFNLGLQEVWIDKNSGGVCLAISSKRMTITGIDDRRYWNHIPTNESRCVYYYYYILFYFLKNKNDCKEYFCFFLQRKNCKEGYY